MDSGRLSAEELAEIRARCEAASPPPWDSLRTIGHPEQGAVPVCKCQPPALGWSYLLTIVEVVSLVGGVPPRAEPRFRRVEDSDFVAFARRDVPALLAEIDRLQGIIRGLADRVATQSELLSKRAEK